MTKRKNIEDLKLEKHGATGTSEYIAWRNMKDRCLLETSHAYKNYGARGITICDSWKNSFSAFLSDMGNRPGDEFSIDRKDNSLGYFKENCRWTTRKVQTINRRIPAKASGLPVGISKRKSGTYTAKIKINGKVYIIGTFATMNEASLNFREVYKEWYGKELV